ncbi:MAG: hypothetical protein IK120_00090 [Muribaculaceae bacterium]|nr:hypothetical protein [Muribaculaceae bacterium]
MKHLNKILCMAMLAFAAAAFTSCGDDEPAPEPTPKPNENKFVFDGTECQIVNASAYVISSNGCRFVLADDASVDLSKKVPDALLNSFDYVMIDCPSAKFGKTITNPADLNDGGWYYYLCTKLKNQNNRTYFQDNLTSISSYVNFSDGKLEVKISAEATIDGAKHKLTVNYSGKPVAANEYIL